MPSYERDNEVEVAFSSQKNNISLYILKKAALDKFRDKLKGVSVGKGCIRYNKPQKIDFNIVRRILKETAQSKGKVC